MAATETYDKILQTARRLFVQQGYTATSMRQVAEQAGIGKATIYHHFPDKKAIVMALHQRNLARMGEAVQLVRTEGDPRRRIQIAATTSVKFLFESADIMQIVRREVSGGRDQMQAGFMKFFQEYMSLLADAIRRGTEQGIFRPVDPINAARVLMTMIQGTFAMAYLGGGHPQSSEEAAAALLDVYFQGIDAR
jgi:AcrR family transcriptional regulator